MTTKLANIVKFALMADECTAIKGCEMLSIMVRYLNGKEMIEFICHRRTGCVNDSGRYNISNRGADEDQQLEHN